MATNTSILGLTKPTYAEDQDVTVLNSNFDLIDAEAGRLRANFAGTYSTSSAYAVGDYCIYQGNLYRCTTAISSSGEAWNASHWSQVSAGDELASANQAIANINPLRGGITTIASDTTIIGLDFGTYQVVLGSSTPVTNGYIPSMYGTLTINDSGSNYKSYTFVSTANKVYSRICHKGDSTWYTAWKELVLKSDLTPSGYTAPTSIHANATLVQGGYVRVGNMIVVNCRLTINTAISATTTIAKFPGYTKTGISYSHVALANNKLIDLGIDQGGDLRSPVQVTTGTLVISGVYFALS